MQTNKLSFLLIVSLIGAAYCGQAQSATSPDGKWVIYVKRVPGPGIDYGGKQARGADPDPPTELWQIDAQGHNATRLLKCRDSDDYRLKLVGFENFHFSSDGRLLYFDSPIWARNNAVHVVDTTNGKEHFITDGSLEDVQHDATAGDLLVVTKGKYVTKPQFMNVIPDYYQTFLVTLDGKEIKALGPQEVP
jgi:Tol biopolymer transport system component